MGDQDEAVTDQDEAVTAQNKAVDAQDEAFDALLEQSSLAAEGARQLSERTPLSLARAVRRIAALRRHIACLTAGEGERLSSVRELRRLLEALGYPADDEIPDDLREAELRTASTTASAQTVDSHRAEQAFGHSGEPSVGRASASRTLTSTSHGTHERPTDGPGRSAVGLQESRSSDVSLTSGDHNAAPHTRADRSEEQGAEVSRFWHVTLTVTGPARPLAEVRRALEQLAHEHPFMLTSRYATDHAEIRYWEEARDLHDAAAVALRVWYEHRDSARLPPWEVDGLEVIDRKTYHQRVADASADTSSDSGADEPRGGRGKAVADRGRPFGGPA